MKYQEFPFLNCYLTLGTHGYVMLLIKKNV